MQAGKPESTQSSLTAASILQELNMASPTSRGLLWRAKGEPRRRGAKGLCPVASPHGGNVGSETQNQRFIPFSARCDPPSFRGEGIGGLGLRWQRPSATINHRRECGLQAHFHLRYAAPPMAPTRRNGSVRRPVFSMMRATVRGILNTGQRLTAAAWCPNSADRLRRGPATPTLRKASEGI